jgi:Tfp pilus assembly protein PilZ
MIGPSTTAHPWLEDEPPTWPRVVVAPELVIVHVEVTLSSESQLFAHVASPGSARGVFVETERRLATGSRVGLLLSLPAGDVEALGVVEWARDASETVSPGVGIAFDGLASGALALIQDFCRLRPPLQHQGCDTANADAP